jgi:hypothetical protein
MLENQQRRDHFREKGVGGIILKWMPKEQAVRVWPRFSTVSSSRQLRKSELSVSITGGKHLNQLSDYQILNEDYDP